MTKSTLSPTEFYAKSSWSSTCKQCRHRGGVLLLFFAVRQYRKRLEVFVPVSIHSVVAYSSCMVFFFPSVFNNYSTQTHSVIVNTQRVSAALMMAKHNILNTVTYLCVGDGGDIKIYMFMFTLRCTVVRNVILRCQKSIF